MKKILCIVAGQRSGTTALKIALRTTGQFRNFGEVFHTQELSLDSEGAFLHYAKQRDLKVVEMATGAHEVAGSYIRHIQSLAGDKIPLIDVKFNSWHVIRSFWSYAHEEPLFMRKLKQVPCHFVFIIRRDLTGQLLSEKIAGATGKWHQLEKDDLDQPVAVNINQVLNQGRLILNSERLFFNYLRTYPGVTTTAYEDLLIDGAVNPAFLAELGKALDVSLPAELLTPIRKNKVDKVQAISNYEEVRKAVEELVRRQGRIL